MKNTIMILSFFFFLSVSIFFGIDWRLHNFNFYSDGFRDRGIVWPLALQVLSFVQDNSPRSDLSENFLFTVSGLYDEAVEVNDI